MIVWKSIIVLFATLLAACNGIDHTVQPTLRSKDGKLEVTITIGPVLYNNSITGLVQNLVGYNGVVGGPTLYVKPGDELTVTLINDLPKEPCNTNVPALHNSYHAVDITNLHFHGLHIAEKYNPMHLELQPGDTYTYKFKIPGHHQGGTHWYHPHPPGSTSLQAGGGAVGLLIVEDLEGDIPQDILELPDLNLRVQFLNMTYLQDDYAAGTVAGTSGSYVDLCKAHCLPEANRPLCKEFFFEDGPLEGEYNTTMSPDGLEYETTLVNGVEQPTIEIIKDQWYRARILHVPTRFRTLEPAFPNCEVRLLAKDGLYMLETPRNVSSGFMTSGSRADFLVRCSEVGLQEFRSLSLARDSSNWIASQKRPSLDRVLAYLNVVEGIGRMDEYSNPKDIEVFKPSRPCYLADMRDVVPDKEDYVLMSGLLPNGGGLADDLPLDRPACCAATSYYDVNGIGAFNIDHRAEISAVNEHQYDFSVATGQIWDVDFYAPQIHPVHYHVNRYQLIALLVYKRFPFSLSSP
jgi:FtsP/CotA-like multicopper oxidase with cupredoxin domain